MQITGAFILNFNGIKNIHITISIFEFLFMNPYLRIVLKTFLREHKKITLIAL